MYLLPLIIALLLAAAIAAAAWVARRRALDRWLPWYPLQARKRRPWRADEPAHLLLCIADHYEPTNGDAPPDVARNRVERWLAEYPRLFGFARDCDDRPPCHTFFYPLELYNPAEIDALATLCRGGFGEVEVHLHHDGESADSLRRRLLEYKHLLWRRHNLLGRRNGQIVYGFVHGNWALDNSLPGGHYCGVTGELEVLRQTGCYADFTLPAAPSPAQTRKINSIYYAAGDPNRPKSHDRGIDLGTTPPRPRDLVIIQGPLLLDWRRRKWGLVPHVENACIQGNQAPTLDRLQLWLKARIQVPQRPDWFFVKLHTHGAPEANQAVLLGPAMAGFHRELHRLSRRHSSFRYHYVSAREMYNLARAAEAGFDGDVDQARDFEVTRHPRYAMPREDAPMAQEPAAPPSPRGVA